MARQKLFWGAVVSAVAPMVVGGLFGCDSGGGGGGGTSGKSSAIRDFMAEEQRQSDRFVDQTAAKREASRQEQDRTAEELAAKAFEDDRELQKATRNQFAEKWQPIQDTMENG